MKPVPFNQYYRKFINTKEYELMIECGYNPKRVSCGFYIKEMLDSGITFKQLRNLIPNNFIWLLKSIFNKRLKPHLGIDWNIINNELKLLPPPDPNYYTMYPFRTSSLKEINNIGTKKEQ